MVKRARGETIHYMFEGTEPIFQKNISTGKIKSYVFAGSMLISRVDGVIGDTEAKKYWYHADQVGSVKTVTNQAGDEVWNADYLPFGTQYMKNKLDLDFEEDDLGFTGKGYDSDVGLYYFNARWYDADTGRFISEDPMADPNNPNLYSYCANNPLSNTDPTGLYIGNDGSDLAGPPKPGDNGGGTGGGNPGTGGGSNTTNKYNKDGTLKSTRTTDNNVQTTIYYKKDGTTVDHVSVIDYNTGMQTLTYYRENGVRSETTFNSRGDIVGYKKWTPVTSAPLSDAGYYQYFNQESLFDEYNSLQGILQAELASIPSDPGQWLEWFNNWKNFENLVLSIVGCDKNKILIKGTIPDGLKVDSELGIKLLAEAKSGKYIYLTNQLRTFIDAAKDKFQLYVRDGAKISAPLLQQILRNGGKVFRMSAEGVPSQVNIGAELLAIGHSEACILPVIPKFIFQYHMYVDENGQVRWGIPSNVY